MTKASRAGLLQTHNISAVYFTPSFPGVTHREAIVYISVWIIVLRPEEIDELYVCSTTNIRQFSHFVQVFSVPE
jgi:hypothetical protein